ncbi:MAG: xanthine dehydrogenase family protein subunit M [Thermodesulfobacteriota bacterium]|nr:xanthine dehydrogenase family protein subunit M [Thermodesulfobacteriota bacterium]
MIRKLRKFDYLKPDTVAEAVSLLEDYQEKASLLSGGTDLLVFMKLGAKNPKYVIDIKGISALDYMSWSITDGLRIGNLTTIQSLIGHPLIQDRLPMLEQAAKAVGHPQIRNRATIAGNICTASPSGDMAPSLLALGAGVKVASLAGERTIPVQEIFTGPFKTLLAPTDMVIEIHVPALPPRSAGSYFWQPKITAVDETLAGAAAVVTLTDGKVLKDVRIGMGSVAPTPIRALRAEEFLKGKQVEDKLFEEAANIAAGESRPRTRADYRREITKLLVEQALKEAANQAIRTEVNR